MADIRTLPKELQIVAETELDEIPDKINENLQTLRNWIEHQPHLNARLDNQFLIQYLRGCKYNLDKAKVKLDLFYTLKSKFPPLFNVTDVNNAKFKQLYNLGFCVPLPNPLGSNGPRLLLFNYEKFVATDFTDLEELFQVVNAMHEIFIMDDPYAGINGVLYIVDLKDITASIASKFTPSFLRKLVQFYEKSLPLRIKGAHIINTPGYCYSVLNILLPLLSEKLKQRLSFYGTNYDKLYDSVPQKYLPSYLGGENGSIDEIIQDFEKKWLLYEDYFKQNINYGTDESLRPGKAIDFDNLFGLGGSFRQLDVD